MESGEGHGPARAHLLRRASVPPWKEAPDGPGRQPGWPRESQDSASRMEFKVTGDIVMERRRDPRNSDAGSGVSEGGRVAHFLRLQSKKQVGNLDAFFIFMILSKGLSRMPKCTVLSSGSALTPDPVSTSDLGLGLRASSVLALGPPVRPSNSRLSLCLPELRRPPRAPALIKI